MSKAKATKIPAHIDLDVYIGEHDVFVRVDPPDETNKSDKWELIQQFYRWVTSTTGEKPEDIWNSKLGYAVLPLRFFRALQEDFPITLLSKREFFLEG